MNISDLRKRDIPTLSDAEVILLLIQTDRWNSMQANTKATWLATELRNRGLNLSDKDIHTIGTRF